MSRHTTTSVMKLARAKWGKADLRVDQGAPDASERARRLARRSEIVRRLKELDESLNSNAGHAERLAKAVRKFVDAGNVISKELAKALSTSEEVVAMIGERRDLKEERDTIFTHRHRFEIGVHRGVFIEIVAYGDTLDEVAAKIAAKGGS